MKPEEIKNEKLEQELNEDELDNVAGGKEILTMTKNDSMQGFF